MRQTSGNGKNYWKKLDGTFSAPQMSRELICILHGIWQMTIKSKKLF